MTTNTMKFLLLIGAVAGGVLLKQLGFPVWAGFLWAIIIGSIAWWCFARGK
ncbi:hypothetical protein WNY59_13965 [Ahrensia kielensis]|uniref:Uncharacterized protein n=1 Tax=Ahrensia kielensis TaxID=76980 RepID=A0ABU9T997_9HYPH